MSRLWCFGFALCLASACGTGTTSALKTASDSETARPARAAEAREPRDDELPGLDGDAVVTVVSDHTSAVTGCHVVGFSGGPAHAGSVTLSWFINPDGSVRDVQVADSSFDSEEFHACLVTIVAGITFPHAPGSTEVGGWRFRFRSRGGSDPHSSAAFNE